MQAPRAAILGVWAAGCWFVNYRSCKQADNDKVEVGGFACSAVIGDSVQLHVS